MSTPSLRLGTRASALAMWQARHVAAAIGRLPDAPPVEILEIKSTGDVVTDIALWKTAGKGFFTAELDRALIEKRIDLAAHSLKDLPTRTMAELRVAAVLEREDPRDALIVRAGLDPDALPDKACVGTSSLRRRAFAARWRRDLTHKDLRGNVPTRIEKLDDGAYDAIILAAAGLKRLDLAERVSRFISIDIFPPAVAQGAVAVMIRSDDSHAAHWVSLLDHIHTRIAVEAERAVLRRLEGGCQIPLGALARMDGDTLHLRAEVCALDGTFSVSAENQGDPKDPEALGITIAEKLLRDGAHRALATMPSPGSTS